MLLFYTIVNINVYKVIKFLLHVVIDNSALIHVNNILTICKILMFNILKY